MPHEANELMEAFESLIHVVKAHIDHHFHHLEQRLAQMALDQTAVDSALSALTGAVTSVATEVANLKAGTGTPPVDTASQAQAQQLLDGVNAATSNLNALLTPPPAA